MSAQTLVLRNRMALAGWIFMAIWISLLCLITYILVRDGSIPGTGPLAGMGVIALFWIFGVAGCAYAYAIPCVAVTIRDRRVSVRERFLMRTREETFPVANLMTPLLVETKDDEGEPYFRCELTTPAGRKVVCNEGHDRASVEAARARVLAFLS
jgi:hypothetical protein